MRLITRCRRRMAHGLSVAAVGLVLAAAMPRRMGTALLVLLASDDMLITQDDADCPDGVQASFDGLSAIPETLHVIIPNHEPVAIESLRRPQPTRQSLVPRGTSSRAPPRSA